MIKSLTVKNFQSHEHSVLEFDSGVNIIIGNSDSGKSALLRALYWIRENRPTTTEFIRNGSGSAGKRGAKRIGTAEATIEVEKAGKVIVVSRIRGQDVNRYVVGGQSFDALGKDVPAEVTEVLGLDKINVQKQIELPYLILDSPGQVASTFNKFTNLDKIDAAISLLSSDLRETSSKKSTAEQELETVRQQLKSFDYLSELEKLVDVAEEIVAEELSASTAWSTLKGLTEQVVSIQQALAELNTMVIVNEADAKRVREGFAKVQSINARWQATDDQVRALSSVVEQYRSALARMGEIDKKLPARIKERELMGKRLSLVKNRVDLEAVVNGLTSVRGLVIKLQGQVKECGAEEGKLKAELQQQKKLLADVDTCITCGQKLLTAEAKATMLTAVGRS